MVRRLGLAKAHCHSYVQSAVQYGAHVVGYGLRERSEAVLCQGDGNETLGVRTSCITVAKVY